MSLTIYIYIIISQILVVESQCCWCCCGWWCCCCWNPGNFVFKMKLSPSIRLSNVGKKLMGCSEISRAYSTHLIITKEKAEVCWKWINQTRWNKTFYQLNISISIWMIICWGEIAVISTTHARHTRLAHAPQFYFWICSTICFSSLWIKHSFSTSCSQSPLLLRCFLVAFH